MLNLDLKFFLLQDWIFLSMCAKNQDKIQRIALKKVIMFPQQISIS